MIYKVNIHIDNNNEIHIIKYEQFKETHKLFFNNQFNNCGFVEIDYDDIFSIDSEDYCEDDGYYFLINMDFAISDDDGKKPMIFTEAMQIQQSLKTKLRKNKLERVLNE